jgi:2-polyprenyl-3-methyl-5-hydroxy-6-metoxy-1,4-benzoquinol methylase
MDDRMENGNDENVIKQFDKIAFLPDEWDHNQQYQKYLLKNIPKNCNCILDVGCGTGELTKKLTHYSKEIIGIDVSENMINEAKKRNCGERIKYIKISVERYLKETKKQFDVIISIAALHHMNEEKILETMKNRLTKGGKIIILDLVKGSIVDYIVAIIAVPLSIIFRLKNNGKIKVTKEQKEAWEGHFHYDKYLTIKEVKNMVRKKLGKAKVKKHLFWRYSIVYKNG